MNSLLHTAFEELTTRLHETSVRAAEWEKILDALPDPLIVLAAGGDIRFANQATCELLGYTPTELLGQDIGIVMVGGLFGQSPGTKQGRWLGAKLGCEYRRKNGATIPMELACSSLRNSSGELSGIVCSATDQRRQRKIEQALRQSELMLGSVFDAIPDPLAVRDRDLRILFSNRPAAATSATGDGPGLFPDFCHLRQDTFCTPCLVREVFASGTPQRQEKYDARDGSTREYNAYPIVDADGSVVMAIEHIHDITHRIAAERKLRDSEQRFQLFMDNVPGAVLIWNQHGKILFGNRFAREALGLGAEEHGPGTQESYTASALPSILKAPLSEPVQAQVVSLNDSNGRLRIFSVCRFAIGDGHDALAGAIALEISAQKEAEEFARQVIENIGDGLVMLDRNLTILACNAAYLRQMDAGETNAVGRTCYEFARGLSSPCHKNGMECPVQRTLIDGQAHTALHEHRHADGSTSLLELRSFPIPNADGTISRVVELVKDITEQKRLETQLQQAQKLEAIGTLAGGIAHDFNNILGAILGYSELARMHTSDKSTVQDLEEIIIAAKRAAELVQQILSFSRHAEEEAQPVQMRFLVKEVLKLLRSTMPSSIEIVQDISPDLPPVLADPTRLHQVLMNLCTNAKQAMREQKGVLRVTLHERRIDDPQQLDCPQIPPGTYLDLEVSDNGCGMEPQVRSRIFDPFFTTKAKGQGTGLGLSVVHGIVTRFGGGDHRRQPAWPRQYLPRLSAGDRDRRIRRTGRGRCRRGHTPGRGHGAAGGR